MTDNIVVGTYIPDEVDPIRPPTSISEMITDGKADYQQAWSNYVFLDKKYIEYQKQVRELTTWLLSTVSKTYQMTCCKEEKTLTDWYTALKETGSVYEVRLKSQ